MTVERELVDLQTKIDLLANAPLFSNFTHRELSKVAAEKAVPLVGARRDSFAFRGARDARFAAPAAVQASSHRGGAGAAVRNRWADLRLDGESRLIGMLSALPVRCDGGCNRHRAGSLSAAKGGSDEARNVLCGFLCVDGRHNRL